MRTGAELGWVRDLGREGLCHETGCRRPLWVAGGRHPLGVNFTARGAVLMWKSNKVTGFPPVCPHREAGDEAPAEQAGGLWSVWSSDCRAATEDERRDGGGNTATATLVYLLGDGRCVASTRGIPKLPASQRSAEKPRPHHPSAPLGHQGVELSCQLIGVERFGHEGIGAERVASVPIFLGRLGRQHHDRYVARSLVLAQATQHLESIHLGITRSRTTASGVWSKAAWSPSSPELAQLTAIPEFVRLIRQSKSMSRSSSITNTVPTVDPFSATKVRIGNPSRRSRWFIRVILLESDIGFVETLPIATAAAAAARSVLATRRSAPLSSRTGVSAVRVCSYVRLTSRD